MSDKPPEIKYAESFKDLGEVLQSVEVPGAFVVSGRLETAMPELRVDGVGRIAFPVLPMQSVSMIQAVAEKAPYGKGAETLLDESVRKVWQISPEKIILQGAKWDTGIQKLLKVVGEGFGLKKESFSMELYKLLIYEEGGFFSAHRDSEKANGMFGTLVVTLPSEHEGGELIVRHGGKEKTLDLRCEDSEEICYAAFYADCEHEVLPVKSGYRICLIYNLLARRGMQIHTPIIYDYADKIEESASILSTWSQREGAPNKLAYILSHHYTQAALSFAALKGEDALLAEIVKSAVKKAGCEIYLGMVHIEESGTAEYSGYRGYRGSRWQDDDDDDEDDFEVGEVYDGSQHIDEWRDERDRPTNFGKITLEAGETLPMGALDDEEPDEQNFTGATGNAGASFERTYLRAALIFWPSWNTNDILMSEGNDAAVAYLWQKINTYLESKTCEDMESIRKVAKMTADRWSVQSYGHAHIKPFGNLLASLNEVKDIALWLQIIAPIVKHSYSGAHNCILSSSCRQFASNPDFVDVVTGLFRDFPTRQVPSLIDLWIKIVAEKNSELAEVAFQAFLPSLQISQTDGISNFTRAFEFVEEKDAPCFFGCKLQSEIKNLDAPLLHKFLHAIASAGLQAQAPIVFDFMIKSPVYFSPEKLIGPMLQIQDQSRKKLGFSLVPLWEYVARYLLKRSEYFPKEPEDWAIPEKLESSDPLIQELKAFARDTEARQHRFRVKQEYRNEIMSVVNQYKMDIDCTEEKKGSPHTLICDKNRNTYKAACQQYMNDIQSMKGLICLKMVEECDAALKNRLCAAIEKKT